MKRLGLFVLAAVVIITALTSVSQTAVAADAGRTTLVVLVNQSPRHFNGAVQSGAATMFPSAQLFASPLMFDDKWQPHPYLAKSWEFSPDGLTLTLHLVKGATFHDGKPITSEDVAFSIMTIKKNHPFKAMFAPVEKIDTPDPNTAVIHLAHPHPAILLAMSQALCPIIPKHIFGDGQDVKTHPMNMKPVGSGPFKFVEYKPGEYYILEGYDKFFLGAPRIKKLIVKIIPDSVTRVTAMKNKEGNIDAFVTELKDIKPYKKTPFLQVETAAPAVGPINWLEFNVKQKPLDDKRVRQAICYAIDKKFILNKLLLGLSKRATGPIVPDSPFYTPDVEHYDLNLDKANTLLDEAGYPRKDGGMRFSLTVDYIPGQLEQQKNLAEYMKPQLKKIGINVIIRSSPDFPSWAKIVSNYDFEMTMDNVWNWGDPVIGVQRTYETSNIHKGVIFSNTTRYSNPKVDELLNKAAMELDQAKRKALYDEFQKIVVNDAPIAYINSSPFYLAYDKKLRSVNTTIWGIMSPLYKTYWEK
ncbi:MAG: ABC transporter substrate-binding protein [Desulfobacterales bacterium]|jgi:peptide/nickel transport system substrate-binding protein